MYDEVMKGLVAVVRLEVVDNGEISKLAICKTSYRLWMIEILSVCEDEGRRVLEALQSLRRSEV
jgi:hypothetical protein